MLPSFRFCEKGIDYKFCIFFGQPEYFNDGAGTLTECFFFFYSGRYIRKENILRLPYSLSGVFSYQPLTLLIRVGYPQTYISIESLYNSLNDGEISFS